MRSGATHMRLFGLGADPIISIPSERDAAAKEEERSRLAYLYQVGFLTKAQFDEQMAALAAKYPAVGIRPQSPVATLDAPIGTANPLGLDAATLKNVELPASKPFNFLDWWRCDNKEGWGPIPNAAARGACHVRNGVLIIAAAAVVGGLMFMMKEIAPDA